MSERVKKFSMIDCMLSVICVVFTSEAIAPAAAIGNSAFFWWLLLIVLFCAPYGLVVSELGTTYADDDGGLYDWVRRAFGDKMASRVGWMYWINFPLWIASLAVVFPPTITSLTGIELPLVVQIAIEFAFIWVVTIAAFSRVSDAKWILNTAAVMKIIIACTLGGLGLWFALTHGFASGLEPMSFLPSFDPNSLTYIGIIIFNFMGFEVIATYTDDMENPRVQIPKAIIIGGLIISAIYIICTFGIGAAIPADELSTSSGVVDAVATMAGSTSWIVYVIGFLFLITLVGNMVSWSFGVNFVAVCAAKDGNLPKFFGTETKNGMPKGAPLMNGIVASGCVLLLPLAEFAGLSDLFWALFSVGMVLLIVSYIPMFLAFPKLRQVDPSAEHPFEVPGGSGFHKALTYVPVAVILIATFMTLVPLNGTPEEMSKLLLLALTIGFLVAGEVVRVVCARNREHAYLGMAVSGEPPAREIDLALVEEEKELREELDYDPVVSETSEKVLAQSAESAANAVDLAGISVSPMPNDPKVQAAKEGLVEDDIRETET